MVCEHYKLNNEHQHLRLLYLCWIFIRWLQIAAWLCAMTATPCTRSSPTKWTPWCPSWWWRRCQTPPMKWLVALTSKSKRLRKWLSCLWNTQSCLRLWELHSPRWVIHRTTASAVSREEAVHFRPVSLQSVVFLCCFDLLQGVLLYGPPGTGKTLLARAVAHHTDCTFIRVSGSELVQKFIGEGEPRLRPFRSPARQSDWTTAFTPCSFLPCRRSNGARALCDGSRTRSIDHLHGRDRLHRVLPPGGRLGWRQRGAENNAGTPQPAGWIWSHQEHQGTTDDRITPDKRFSLSYAASEFVFLN